MKRSPNADKLCAKWEGYHDDDMPNGDCKAYSDPGPTGLPITIGMGTTYYPAGTSAAQKYGARPVDRKDTLTRTQAEECFVFVMNEREELVRARLSAPVTQSMFDALVSFYYNLHPDSWPQQIDRCNAGRYEECAASFDLYVLAGGVKLPGLVNRRNEEESLFRVEGLNPLASESGESQPNRNLSLNADFYPYRPLPIPWKRDDKYLSIGDKHDDVLELRCAFMGLGFIPKVLLVSDVFDEELASAVEKFQKLKDIKVDAVVGDDTAAAIEDAMAVARGFDRSGLLIATYYSQWNNINEPESTCGITSAAMLLSAHGTVVNPDQIYNRFGKVRGQSPEGLSGIYGEYGYQGKYSYTGTFSDIRMAIDRGSPVVIHGYFTKAGHIVCVIGYRKTGLVIDDPAGAWNGQIKTSYNFLPKDGRGVVYSYDSLETIDISDGDIWMSYIG